MKRDLVATLEKGALAVKDVVGRPRPGADRGVPGRVSVARRGPRVGKGLVEREHRAVAEATALVDLRLAPLWQQVRAEPANTRASVSRNGFGCCG